MLWNISSYIMWCWSRGNIWCQWNKCRTHFFSRPILVNKTHVVHYQHNVYVVLIEYLKRRGGSRIFWIFWCVLCVCVCVCVWVRVLFKEKGVTTRTRLLVGACPSAWKGDSCFMKLGHLLTQTNTLVPTGHQNPPGPSWIRWQPTLINTNAVGSYQYMSWMTWRSDMKSHASIVLIGVCGTQRVRYTAHISQAIM